MMKDVVLPILISTGIATGVGLFGYFLHRLVTGIENKAKEDRAELLELIEASQKRINEHEADCNRVPKAAVLKQIEGLYERHDIHYLETLRRFDALEKSMDTSKLDLKEYIDSVHASFSEFRAVVMDHLLNPKARS